MRNPRPFATVDAKVDDGFVTRTGTADWQYQRDEAELVASNIVGALDVIDEIELNGRRADTARARSVRVARARDVEPGDLRTTGHQRKRRQKRTSPASSRNSTCATASKP